MRLLATLVVVVLVALPSIFAGWPGAEPGFFDARIGGVPGSVLAMVLLLAVFVPIAGWCSRAARGDSAALDSGAE